MDSTIVTEIKLELEELLRRSLIEEYHNEEVASISLLDCYKDLIASSQLKARVVLESGNVLNIFLKILSKSCPLYGADKTLKIFEREHMMYELLKDMADFQERCFRTSHNQIISIKNMFPKYYGRGVVKDVVYLVMEDFITGQGFSVTAKEAFHTLEQVKSVMISLGTFHATSFAMKDMKNPVPGEKIPINFREKYPLLECMLTAPQNEDVISSFTTKSYIHNVNILEAVTKALANNDLIAHNKIKSRCRTEEILRLKAMAPYLLKIMHKVQSPQEPGALVTHGDFHAFNIAFAKETVKFFDLQVSRYSSGMIDVHHYISQITTPEFRAVYLPEILSAYLNSFNNFCSIAGVSPLFNNVSDIMNEYLAKAPWGLFCGLCWIFWRFVENFEVFNKTAEILGIEKGVIFEVVDEAGAKQDYESDCKDVNIMAELDKCGGRIWWGVQVLLDLVEEMTSQGTIDIMECIYNDILKSEKETA